MNEIMARQTSQVGEYQESKQLSEIKGKMFLARQFPRDPEQSLQNVLMECQRPKLAEAAQYEYPKGDSVVTGPSIRLVEVLARHWGNIDSGVAEIDTHSDHTVVKAYAWDLENNVSDEKTFTVQHVRSVGKGSKRTTYKLTDERDIYEMVANKAARRKRSCLLAVMPGWYVEAALDACNETLRNSVTNGKTIEEVREAVVAAFAEFGVSPDNIAAKLSRPIDKLDPNDIVKLRHLYAAIKDGFVKAQDAFDLFATTPEDLPSEEEENALEALNRELTGGRDAADS